MGRNQIVAGAAVAVLLAGCGGGGSKAASTTTSVGAPTTTAATSVTLVAATGAALQGQVQAVLRALQTAYEGTDPTRAASDLAAAKAAERTGRDALYAYDAQLRKVALPDAVIPARNDVLSAIGAAIQSLDDLGAAPDATAFAAARQQVPAKVQAFYAAQDALDAKIGLPTTRQLQAAGSASSTTSTSAAAARTPVADATALRDRLLAAATGSAVSKDGSVAAWQAFTSQVGFQGSGLAATPTAVSGFSFVTSKAKGVDYLAFAVADAAGRCAAGVLEAAGAGSSVTSAKPATAPSGACRADAVAEAAGY